MKNTGKAKVMVALLSFIMMVGLFTINVFADEADTEMNYDDQIMLISEDEAVEAESPEFIVLNSDGDEINLYEFEDANKFTDNYDEFILLDPDNFNLNLSVAVTTIRDNVRIYGTFLALIPPIIAIVLALITKEVYSSLFIGILSGALLYTWFRPVETVTTTFSTIIGKLSDGWNIGIIIFLVILGIMVSMMNKAGGSAAYGEWASAKIKNKTGAALSTFLLGSLIFVDDYFNCLTVGSVMRPVTDKQKISRAKLAYLIDATAAPICIIAPISSWAAAVTSVAPSGDGLKLFVSSIPYNFYALLTIVMIITISLLKFDYGPMKKHEENALRGDLYTSGADTARKVEALTSKKGKVIDLILPVVVLIALCIVGMVYTGGFFEGVDFVTAFSESDASVGLVLGSFVAFVFTVIFYLLRRSLTFKEISESLTDGFKAMVPAILILTFAWTLSGITMQLGAKVFVAEFVRNNVANLTWLLPAIIFVIAVGLAFATGTSWGTFGILLPIVCAVFAQGDELMVISISACLAGAVCGDHCSPISDTTIMASAGAECNHINHVSTQLPYALTVAGVSFVSFILAGLIKSPIIVLPIGIVMMVAVLFVIKVITSKKKED